MAVYKPLSNSQIDAVVSDFLGRHKDRSADIDAAIAQRQKAATAAQVPSAADAAATRAEQTKPGGRNSVGTNPGTVRSGMQGAFDAVSGIWGAKPIIDAATEDGGVAQAPANPLQWALNFLSTPVYVAGEVTGGLLDAGERRDAAAKRAGIAPSGNPAAQGLERYAGELANGGNAATALGGAVGDTAAAVAGGAARGVAEGLGFRFDNKRAVTLGDQTARLGINKAVGDFADTGKYFGAAPGVGDLAAGATGFAADAIVPIPGVAAVRGAAAGAKGAADAARAAEGLGKITAIPKGFSAGKAASEAQAVAAAARKAAAREARKNGERTDLAGGVAEDAAARSSAQADIAAEAAAAGDDDVAEAAARTAHETYVGGRGAREGGLNEAYADVIEPHLRQPGETVAQWRRRLQRPGTAPSASRELARNPDDVFDAEPFLPSVTGTRELGSQGPLRVDLTATPDRGRLQPSVEGRNALEAPVRPGTAGALEAGRGAAGRELDLIDGGRVYDAVPFEEPRALSNALDVGELTATKYVRPMPAAARRGELEAPRAPEPEAPAAAAAEPSFPSMAEATARQEPLQENPYATFEQWSSRTADTLRTAGSEQLVKIRGREYRLRDIVRPSFYETRPTIRKYLETLWAKDRDRAEAYIARQADGDAPAAPAAPKAETAQEQYARAVAEEQARPMSAGEKAAAIASAKRDPAAAIRDGELLPGFQRLRDSLDGEPASGKRVAAVNAILGREESTASQAEQTLRRLLVGKAEDSRVAPGDADYDVMGRITPEERAEAARIRGDKPRTEASERIRPEFEAELAAVEPISAGASSEFRNAWYAQTNAIRPQSSAEVDLKIAVLKLRDGLERPTKLPPVQPRRPGGHASPDSPAARQLRARPSDGIVKGELSPMARSLEKGLTEAPGSNARRAQIDNALGPVRDGATPTELKLRALLLGTDDAGRVEVLDQAALNAARADAVAALLPKLQDRTPLGASGVDVDAVLAKAAGRAPLLDEAAHASLMGALVDSENVAQMLTQLQAIGKTANGKKILTASIPFGGKSITVARALERAVMGRLNGGDAATPESVQISQFLTVLFDRARQPGAMTEDALRAALAEVPGTEKLDVAAVMKQVLAAKASDRKAVLAALLNANTPRGARRFESFDDALQTAIAGGVAPAQMRQMLQALGIETKTTAGASLRKIVADRGVKAWNEVQASIPSKTEVIAQHGMDPETSIAADATDVAAVQQAAAAEAQRAAEDAAEVPPAAPVDPEAPEVAPTIEQPSLEAAVAAERAGLTVKTSPLQLPGRAQGVGDTLPKILADIPIDPANQAIASGKSWRELSTRILKSISLPANVLKLNRQARGDYLYGRLMSRLNAGEAYLKSHGVMPSFTTGGQTWHIGFGQVLEHLDPQTVKRAFFDLDHRLGSGVSPADLERYKQGLTVFPSAFSKGAAMAMRGGDEAAILRAMQADKRASAFLDTPEGQESLRLVAKDMADPAYHDTLRTLHEGQEVIALAFANQAADDLVGPLASQFIDAVARYSGRDEIIDLIKQATAQAERIATDGKGSSLVRDLYRQRSTNGILGRLNEAQGLGLRADLRAMGDDAAQAMKAKETAARDVARTERPKVEGGTAPHSAPKEAPQQMTELRGEAAKNDAQMADEAEAGGLFDEMLDDVHGRDADPETGTLPDSVGAPDEPLPGNFREDTEGARIETLLEVQQAMPFLRRFGDKLGVAFDGSHGMQDVKALLSQFMTGTHVASQKYHAKMTGWAVGDKRLLNEAVRPGLINRLSAEMGGRKLSYDELHDVTRQWWTALAAHSARNPGMTREALEEALTTGATRDVRNMGEASSVSAQLYGDIPPLSPGQAAMAMEMKDLIDEVFSRLGASQTTSDDLIRELGRYGLAKGKLPDAGADMGTQAGLWKTFDFTDGSTPLDTLLTWHRAMEAATVPRSVGLSFGKLLDHRANGLSAAEAKAQGWKRLDTSQANSMIAAHVDPDSWFPPEALKQLTYAEHLLQQAQKASIGTPGMQKYVSAFDYATGILKSSQTIWRPAHHVTNVMGELLINTMAGVNPSYGRYAPAVLRSLGMLEDAPDDLLLALQRQHFAGEVPAGSGPKEVVARITVRGKVVEVTADQLAQYGVNRGALVTPRHARDSLPGSEMQSALGREGVAKFRRNPISRTDEALGRFSATRDNATRIPHLIHALEKQEYRSLDEAFARAADEVNRYHPTIQSLSDFEQKYARRAIYFYTWMRLTAGTVIKHALERPKDIAAIPLAQYELASANGLEPNSVGNPTPTNDERVPSYASQGLLGPTFEAGYSPFGSPDEPTQYGDEAHLWGFSLSAPQVDALEGMFKGGTEPLAGANPFIAMPLEWALNAQPNTAVKPQDDPLRFFGSATGAPWSVASALGAPFTQKAIPKDATPQEAAAVEATNKGGQARAALNLSLGAKFTDYTSLANQRNAHSESIQLRRQQLKDQGYVDEAIDKIIRMESKAAR